MQVKFSKLLTFSLIMLKSISHFADNPWGGNGSSNQNNNTKKTQQDNVLEFEKLLNKYKRIFLVVKITITQRNQYLVLFLLLLLCIFQLVFIPCNLKKKV